MNRHLLRGKLLQWRGVLRETWGVYTSNERLERLGQRDRALGKIEHRHGALTAALTRQRKFLSQYTR